MLLKLELSTENSAMQSTLTELYQNRQPLKIAVENVNIPMYIYEIQSSIDSFTFKLRSGS